MVLACVFLQGCMYQSVDSNELIRAQAFCESKGSKIANINSYAVGITRVVCLSGDQKEIGL